MEEAWKPVEDYPDLFLVSNYGRIWSLRSNKLLKQGNGKNGYKLLSTRIGGREGKPICIKVHRWVAEAFVENPDNKPFVNHKDGDKTNNFDWNLEWCTSKENSIHAFDNNLVSLRKGEENHRSKLTDDDVLLIKRKYKHRCKENGVTALARKFNVHHSIISGIVHNRIWTHII